MRIAFIGAHGTGKTTACNFLVGKLSEYKFIKYPEFAREILDCIANYDPSFDWKVCIKQNPMIYMLFESALSILYSDQSSFDNYVCDRTPLDILAYMRNFWDTAFGDVDAPDIVDHLWDKTWTTCEDILADTTYDLVIFLRIIDGDSLRKRIDKFIYDNLDMINCSNLVFLDEKPNLSQVYQIALEKVEESLYKQVEQQQQVIEKFKQQEKDFDKNFNWETMLPDE